MWIWMASGSVDSHNGALSLSPPSHLSHYKTENSQEGDKKRLEKVAGSGRGQGIGPESGNVGDAKRAAKDRHNILEASLENEYW